MPSVQETPDEFHPLSGRWINYKPAIQSIPIPEGVSDFVDDVRKLQRLVAHSMALPHHVLEEPEPPANMALVKYQRRLNLEEWDRALTAAQERWRNETRRNYRQR